MKGMMPDDRLPFSAITDRKPLPLPDGAKMVLDDQPVHFKITSGKPMVALPYNYELTMPTILVIGTYTGSAHA